MITKISQEQPFQVLTNSFSISPSSSGYDLEISADGKNYTKLFTVAANTTRLVTGVAANSYYRLKGNTDDEVVVNWMKQCVTEGGGGGDMSNYYTKDETDAAIEEAISEVTAGTETYVFSPFPESWDTSGTLTGFCEDVMDDPDARVGMAYYGSLSCSGLPTGMMQGDVIVYVLGSDNNKVLNLVMTSTNLAPYNWEGSYWAGSFSGWRSYEDLDNKVTSISSGSTDTQYPSAKAVYEAITAATEDFVTSGEMETQLEVISNAVNDLDDRVDDVADVLEASNEVISNALNDLHSKVDDMITSGDVETMITGATQDMATKTWVGQQGYAQETAITATVTAITSPIQEQLDDVERVTATAMTELHTMVLEVSASTPDVSSFVTSGDVEDLITAATTGFVTAEELEPQMEVISSALNDLNTNAVRSTSIRNIVSLSQADYNALVSGGTVDSATFYVII